MDFCDLMPTHIEVTRLSYDAHSRQYAEDWEWNRKIATITRHDYLDPFMKIIKKNGVVLVVGCGTGRDLKVLADNGYYYLGVDSSEGMLREAIKKRGIRGPVLCSELETLRLADDSFDGILIDSAVEHIRKSEMKNVLEKLYKGLRVGGVVLLRFRLGNGKVFRVEDSVGVRFFTSYTKDESRDLVVSNGFDVVDDYVTDHMENSRPGFHAYILRK